MASLKNERVMVLVLHLDYMRLGLQSYDPIWKCFIYETEDFRRLLKLYAAFVCQGNF